MVKPWILPKNEQMNSFLLLCYLFSFVFWENPWLDKFAFEIIWPLTLSEKKNLLMKIQTFRNLLSTQHASNLCFSSQACQLTMGKIYKNKKDPHLTLAEKNNIKRREKCFVTKIVLTYCEKKNVLVIEKKLLKFEAKGREFSNFLTWLEQFIQTVKECFFNLFLEVSQI